MVLIISMLLFVLAIIQMVIYYRFGINFFKQMNRHDRKRIRLRQKGIIQQKPTTNQKRQKHNNKSNSGCTHYDPKSDPGYMDEIDEMLQKQLEADDAFWEKHR